ncbi:unnamed protein product [Linum trigynum]|uniref:RNA-dependent RNA polymerase n=1 Tax=Linum trigynum TaxID=586398 RepID=A0AAV2F4K8_9ROSI
MLQINPCKIYFAGLEVNVSNRVLRHFPVDIENFIRVTFIDEELDDIYFTDLAPHGSSANDTKKGALYTLRNGVVVGSKKFEFLAFSTSSCGRTLAGCLLLDPA